MYAEGDHSIMPGAITRRRLRVGNQRESRDVLCTESDGGRELPRLFPNKQSCCWGSLGGLYERLALDVHPRILNFTYFAPGSRGTCCAGVVEA